MDEAKQFDCRRNRDTLSNVPHDRWLWPIAPDSLPLPNGETGEMRARTPQAGGNVPATTFSYRPPLSTLSISPIIKMVLYTRIITTVPTSQNAYIHCRIQHDTLGHE